MSEGVETREVVFDDGTELITDRRGSKIYVAQRIWHVNIDGSEEPEERTSSYRTRGVSRQKDI